MLTLILILVAVLVALLVGALVVGAHRWDSETARLRARLDAAREPVHPSTVDLGQLEGLPAPVRRFFRAALTDGQPMVAAVRVRHAGTFNLDETTDRWKPFTSDQQVVARRPGFDWNGRITMAPGLSVRVHDAYVAGEGLLHASLAGLFSVAALRGTRDLAEGELLRFFAEAAWYPTILLPIQGVRWQEVDDRSALATLHDGDVAVTLLFEFNEAGLIETVRAESRGRRVGDEIVPTPWQGRFWDYHERAGMRVPLEGEVAWVLPQGTRPYWRGRITEISYELAR